MFIIIICLVCCPQYIKNTSMENELRTLGFNTVVLKLVTPPLKVQNFQIFLLGTNFSRFPKILDRLLLTLLPQKTPFSPAKQSKSAIFFGALRAPNFRSY